MSRYFIEGDTLTDIADAIRLKRDSVTEINPEDMPLEISLIDGGGGDLKSYYGTFTGNGTTSQILSLPITPVAFIVRPVSYSDVNGRACLTAWMSFRDYPVASNTNSAPAIKTITFRKTATNTTITTITESAVNQFAEYGNKQIKLKSNNSTYPIAPIDFEIYAIGTED